MKKSITILLLCVCVSLYTFSQAPTILSFSPTSGSVGVLITIKGTNLKNPTTLTISSTALIISSSDTQIVAMLMPTTSINTNIYVANASGSFSTANLFTIKPTLQPNLQQNVILSSKDTLSTYGQGYSTAISADGNTAVVGCPTNFKGWVTVYTRKQNNWVIEVEKLQSTNILGSSSNQGCAVDISADGNTIIVGNYRDSNRTGAAYIYTRIGTAWTEQAKLIGTGAIGKAWMGYKVAISADGNTAIIGGYKDNASIGATWVFIRTNGVWTQSGAKLVGSNYTGIPNQGRAIAISANGKYIVIGGAADNNYAGKTWIYARSGNAFIQQYSIYSNTANAYYGWSVSINADGSTIAVGMPVNGDGKINIFNRTGTTWSYVTDLVASDATTGAELGWDTKISADGKTILAAADYQSSRGAFYLYKKNALGNWIQQGNANYANDITDSTFAYSVAMASDANTAVISSTSANNFMGASYIYVSPLPRISNFTPKICTPLSSVTITGIGFTSTNTVTFGGKNAYSYNLFSDTEINAKNDYGNTGKIVVTNAYGADSIDGFIYCNQIYNLQQTNTLVCNSDTIIHAGANILFKVGYFNQLPPDSLCIFKWYKNNKLVGNNSSTYLDSTLVTGDSVYCIINFTTPCVSMASITTTTLRFTVLPNTPYKINSVAGSIRNGVYPPLFYGDGGQATTAALANPSGVALDKKRNILYIADRDNFRVRKVSLATGIISTYAGGGSTWLGDNGPATWASLGYFDDIALDKIGNLYIATYTDRRIRKVDTLGIITTVAGDGTNGYSGDGTSAVAAQIGEAANIALDSFDNLYISDRANHVIRKVDKQTGIISTIVGKGVSGFSGDGGQAIYAKLYKPEGIAFDKQNNLFIVDKYNNRIRKISASNNFINTIAGGGNWQNGTGDGLPATWAYLSSPQNITIDTFGNCYITEDRDNRIRKINATNNIITTVCGQGNYFYYYYFDSVYNGDGGSATAANISFPQDIITDDAGNIYFADSQNGRIRKITFNSDTASFIAGKIINPKKAAINNVNLLIKTEKGNTNQLISGGYSITNITANSIVLKPTKNNDSAKKNGVSAFDIVLIQNHILNKIKLNSPYKIIAADVTNDKKVSAFDIIYIKRLILGLDTTFAGNRMWAFVDSNYTFPDTTNPFPYKDSISFTNLTSSKINQTFIGVKLGDVNYDWVATTAKGVKTKDVELVVNDKLLGVNDEMRIPITVKNFKELTALQYTLNFNNEAFEFVGIENNKLGIEFNSKQAASTGNISFLWVNDSSEPKSVEDGSELFTLVLRKLTANRQPSTFDLVLTNDIAEIEAWDKDFKQHNIILIQKQQTNNLPLIPNNYFSVSPNPTTGNIVINLISNQNKKITFELSNVQGKTLLQESFEAAKGNNVYYLNLNKNGKLPKGIYIIKANGLEGEKVKKLVVNGD